MIGEVPWLPFRGFKVACAVFCLHDYHTGRKQENKRQKQRNNTDFCAIPAEYGNARAGRFFSSLCGLTAPPLGSFQDGDTIFRLDIMDRIRQFRYRLDDPGIALCSGIVEDLIQNDPSFEKSANAFSIRLLKQVICVSVVVKEETEFSLLRTRTVDHWHHI